MDSDSESDMRKRGEEAVEEEDEKEGQMTDPETGEEDIASGDTRAETGSKVKGLLESESDEELTFKTGSSVKSEGPLESSSDEEVTLSREVMEYGETGGRSDISRNVTRKFPLAAYGDTGRARERERKPGRVGRRAHHWKECTTGSHTRRSGNIYRNKVVRIGKFSDSRRRRNKSLILRKDQVVV